MMDEVATMSGVKDIMLTFDDFLVGLDKFGKRIQPLSALSGGERALTSAGVYPGVRRVTNCRERVNAIRSPALLGRRRMSGRNIRSNNISEY